MPIDATTFRQAAGSFASSVTIISVAAPEGFQGMTATAFCSLSLDPPLILVCLDRNSRTLAEFKKSQEFNVNILGRHQENVSRLFSTRGAGERSLDGVKFRLTASGLPVFEGASAALECRCVELVDGGDHMIVVGEVSNALLQAESNPYCTSEAPIGSLLCPPPD